MRLNPPTNETARGYGVGVRRVRACVRRDAARCVRDAPISAWDLDRAVGGCGSWARAGELVSITCVLFHRYWWVSRYVLYIYVHTYIRLSGGYVTSGAQSVR